MQQLILKNLNLNIKLKKFYTHSIMFKKSNKKKDKKGKNSKQNPAMEE